MTRVTVNHDPRPEGQIRKSLWIGWMVWVTLLACLFCGISGISGHTVLNTMLASLLSVPAGWLLGYKLAIKPLFTGFYIF